MSSRLINIDQANRVNFRSSLSAAVLATNDLFVTQIGGFNDSANALYVLVHDLIAIPPAGPLINLPTIQFYVPAGSSFAWKPTRNGRYMKFGLVFTVSSTRDTYTPDATTIYFFAEGYHY